MKAGVEAEYCKIDFKAEHWQPKMTNASIDADIISHNIATKARDEALHAAKAGHWLFK